MENNDISSNEVKLDETPSNISEGNNNKLDLSEFDTNENNQKIDLNPEKEDIEKEVPIKDKFTNEKITKLESYNKNLKAQIKESQAILLTLQKNYSMLSSQKILFQEIMAAFPGQTPLEIITELKTAKKGSMVLLESFTNMNQEMAEMKKNQEEVYYAVINNILCV